MDSFEVLVNDVRLRLPDSLRWTVGVDMAQRNGLYFEPWVMLAIESVVGEGSVVYDAGCSYGFMGCLLARKVGPAGRIHAFDPNPAVLAEAKRVAALNTLPGQIQFHEICVGEATGTAEFYAVFGRQSVASTRNAEIRHFHGAAE